MSSVEGKIKVCQFFEEISNSEKLTIRDFCKKHNIVKSTLFRSLEKYKTLKETMVNEFHETKGRPASLRGNILFSYIRRTQLRIYLLVEPENTAVGGRKLGSKNKRPAKKDKNYSRKIKRKIAREEKEKKNEDISTVIKILSNHPEYQLFKTDAQPKKISINLLGSPEMRESIKPFYNNCSTMPRQDVIKNYVLLEYDKFEANKQRKKLSERDLAAMKVVMKVIRTII
jgi:hypothetical protein